MRATADKKIALFFGIHIELITLRVENLAPKKINTLGLDCKGDIEFGKN